jgi:hypothetical protein
MSYIVYGHVSEAFNLCDDVFAYDLDQDGVVKCLTEAMETTGKTNGEFKFLIFEDGKLYTQDVARAFIKTAAQQARVSLAAKEKALEAELAAKAEQAAKRQEVLDRQHYEKLKLRFEGAPK